MVPPVPDLALTWVFLMFSVRLHPCPAVPLKLVQQMLGEWEEEDREREDEDREEVTLRLGLRLMRMVVSC